VIYFHFYVATFSLLVYYNLKEERGVKMPEQEFNAVFSKRLRYYLSKYEITQAELAKHLGVGTTSVYNWCNGIKTPRMDKVDAMCDLFNCKRSDLIEEKDDSNDRYYLNDETAQAAQEIFENKELRALFDVQRDMDADDLRALHNMALALKRKERGNDDTGC
jgi:toxin-antitoxin system, antitoxin component, xre family